MANRHDLTRWRSSYLPILVLVLLAACSAIAGWHYYRNYERQHRLEIERKLSAIGELKVDELVQWRKERLGDGAIFHRNASFSEAVRRAFENPSDEIAQEGVRTWLRQVQQHLGYDRLFLLDAQGTERMSVPDIPEPVTSLIARRLPDILRSGQVTLEDLHRDSPDRPIHLTVAVPVFDPQDGSKALGVLGLCVDPEQYLYPYIARWPTPSDSAETLIVRREGNDVLYLNELRFQKNTSLELRFPLERTELPAVKAVLGQQGIVEGRDYRGVPVIADVRPVPDSPWYLVARMDTSEVYAPLRERLWLMAVLVAGLVIGSSGGIGFLWRRQSIRYYRERYETAEELRLLSARQEAILAAVPDIIMEVDTNKVYTWANQAGIQFFGEDVVGREAAFYFEGEHKTYETLRPLFNGNENMIYVESWQRRRDGEKRLLAWWCRVLKDESGNVTGALSSARDITEDERAEGALRESEERCRDLVENSRDLICTHDLEGRVLSVNEAATRLTGYPREALLGMNIADVLDPKVRRLLGVYLTEIQAACRASGLMRIQTASGESRYLEYYSTLRTEGVAAPIVRGMAHDITERRRAEEALQEERRRAQSYLDIAAVAFVALDTEGKVVLVNQRMCETLGCQEAEAVGKGWFENFLPERVRGDVRAVIARLLAGEIEPVKYHENPVLTRSGQERIIAWHNTVVTDKSGSIVGTLSSGEDITERKRAEEALRESEERYRTVARLSSDFAYSCIRQGGGYQVDWITDAFFSITGYSEAALKERKSWLFVSHPDDAGFATTPLQRLCPGERDAREFRIVAKDGRVRWVRNEMECVADPEAQGKARLFGAVRDITEDKRSEEALRQSEERYRSLVERLPLAVFRTTPGPKGEFIMGNAAYLRMLGVESQDELRGRVLSEFYVDPADRRRLSDLVLTDGRVDRMELHIKRKDGTLMWAALSGRLVQEEGQGGQSYIEGFVQDVTEEKQLQAQLLQSQKMEAVGRLAGGVAHDFNNLLTAISGYSTLAIKALPPVHPAREDLDQVLRAADRAAGLTRQLLAFSRRQIIQPRVLCLNELIVDMDKMLRRLIGEDIDLLTMPAAGLWSVRVDPGQMEQVIVNLAVNARDAMPSGGKLTLETTNVTLDARYARRHAGAEPGDYVLLAVSDTGAGMSEEVQARLFEPFFTTKETGKGTGLGLPTVFGIVKQHGGNIQVYSEIGQGTTFKIYLPRVVETPEALPKRLESAALPTGAETVLVVEDEPAVRSFAVRSLVELGYTVLEAANGREALEISAQHGGPVHLLITDVVMPQMGGSELAELLGKVRPGVRLLFISGYTDNAIVHNGILDRGVAFLQKPFAAPVLAQKVREVLEG